MTHGRGYALELADGEIDAVRAERLLEQSRPREALALWRGEPLADLADEPFAAAEIRRLEELRLRATEMAIDADLAAGRHAEVIAELDALVAAHPLRERLHGQRMLALYRAGRQSEALERLPRRARGARRADRRRARRRAAAPARADPRPRPGARPARGGRAGARERSRAPPRRRSRALLAGAAALVLAGVLAFGIIRVLEPDSLSGIGEDHVGLIDPDGGRITAAVLGRPQPRRGHGGRRLGVGRQPGSTARSRASTATARS